MPRIFVVFSPFFISGVRPPKLPAIFTTIYSEDKIDVQTKVAGLEGFNAQLNDKAYRLSNFLEHNHFILVTLEPTSTFSTKNVNADEWKAVLDSFDEYDIDYVNHMDEMVNTIVSIFEMPIK